MMVYARVIAHIWHRDKCDRNIVNISWNLYYILLVLCTDYMPLNICPYVEKNTQMHQSQNIMLYPQLLYEITTLFYDKNTLFTAVSIVIPLAGFKSDINHLYIQLITSPKTPIYGMYLFKSCYSLI